MFNEMIIKLGIEIIFKEVEKKVLQEDFRDIIK